MHRYRCLLNVKAMKNRATEVAAAIAFFGPLLLLVTGSLRRGQATWWSNPELFLSNWAYMLAPAAMVTVLTLPFATARYRFLPQALIMLTLVLVLFQCWVWWLVPVSEGALAWVLYFPVAAVALLALALAHLVAYWWRRGSNSSFKRTPGGAA
jgi:hypothetical protein